MVELVLLAHTRGPCAGVERALDAADHLLRKHNSIYVIHEPVHNNSVTDRLVAKGMIRVDDISDIPFGAVVFFSAHGTPEATIEAARKRGLTIADGTCPLVSKVHRELIKYEADGRTVIIVGTKGHQEVDGHLGHMKDSSKAFVVLTIEDVKRLPIASNTPVAYVMQTTLNFEYAKDVLDKIKETFPDSIGPGMTDVCYATRNRQEALRELCEKSDAVMVIGSSTSSNSKNLRDIAGDLGLPAYLNDEFTDEALEKLKSINTLGITSGASAPDFLVEIAIERIRVLYPDIRVQELQGIPENVKFAPVVS